MSKPVVICPNCGKETKNLPSHMRSHISKASKKKVRPSRANRKFGMMSGYDCI